MPPSGFNRAQAESVVAFLVSCSQALEIEGLAKGETPSEALGREIASIQSDLRGVLRSELQRAVLSLTLEYYKKLASQTLLTWGTFENDARLTAAQVSTEVQDIHVENRERVS